MTCALSAYVRVVCVVALSATLALAQEELTNESIVRLAKSGLSDTLIVSMIRTRPAKFVLTPEDVLQLKANGLSDAVLTAMVQKAASGTAPRPESRLAETPPVKDIGVYYKTGGKWEEVLPEPVNWQNWYMLVNGKSSRTRISAPVEFLIYAPSGVGATEYQLLKLKERPARREFISYGGQVRSSVPFEPKKIATRTYIVSLSTLEPGEYAFMPPGAVQQQNAAGSLGKVYTFQIIP